jgi:drug/metabolite transporter (DMT)-like permease
MVKKGLLLSVVTACISGISVYANSVFVTGVDPLIFAIIRNSGVVLMLTMVLWGRKSDLSILHRKDWLQLVVIGVIGGGIPFAMFFSGLSMIGAVNGNILHKTLFLWVALLAIPFLHERITKLQFVGYVLVFLSLFVFGGTFRLVFATGSYLVLGATLLWAVENVVAKKTLQHIPFDIVAWGRMVFGLPVLFLSALVMGKANLLVFPTSFVTAPVIISSVLLVAYVLTWYKALSQAPATLVSSVLVVAPLVTAVLGMKFVWTPSNVVLLVGVFLIAFRWRFRQV